EWLAEAVAGYGSLVDSYIAKKTNKAGNIFGFVKFKDVKDKRAFERKLKGVTVGVMKARVNLQKFNREGKPVVRGEYSLVQNVNWKTSELWDEEVFNSIGGRFGQVIHVSDVDLNDSNMARNCVGLLVDDWSKVEGEFSINWQDRSFSGGVKEVHEDWEPDFVGVLTAGVSSHDGALSGGGQSATEVSTPEPRKTVSENECSNGVSGVSITRVGKWKRRWKIDVQFKDSVGPDPVQDSSILSLRRREFLVGPDMVEEEGPTKRIKSPLDNLDLNFPPPPPTAPKPVIVKPKEIFQNRRKSISGVDQLNASGPGPDVSLNDFGCCLLNEDDSLTVDNSQDRADLALANEVINSMQAAAMVGIQLIDYEERVKDLVLEDGVIEEV
ncbi:hypothetical protein SSX86_032419, partial [Deinandra increscens subsp. villosa]